MELSWAEGSMSCRSRGCFPPGPLRCLVQGRWHGQIVDNAVTRKNKQPDTIRHLFAQVDDISGSFSVSFQAHLASHYKLPPHMPDAALSKQLVGLGLPVPEHIPHAISVSLPLWTDAVDHELGLDRVLNALQAGYPRFFIHHDIRRLAEVCQAAHALTSSERCMLFPSQKAANLCRNFVADQALKQLGCQLGVENQCRMVTFDVFSSQQSTAFVGQTDCRLRVFVLFVPDDRIFQIAHTFWQHTGLGISSRFANRCLRLLGSDSASKANPILTIVSQLPSPHISPRTGPCRYIFKPSSQISSTIINPTPITPEDESATSYDQERYGPNLSVQFSCAAKLSLRCRIVDILQETATTANTSFSETNLKHSIRGTGKLTEDNVYLYPSGMSSIFFAHQIAMTVHSQIQPNKPMGKSICFGFPYTDTLKIIEKWGPGAHFFGHGETEDLQSLEQLLEHNDLIGDPKIVALFCEFPSNPLLKSPDLIRIRNLADRYGFLVIIDVTIGNFWNVEVLPFTDILVCSLTKIFSGEGNVMGGSLIVNPKSKFFDLSKAILDGDGSYKEGIYEDVYFGEDAICMERNSRDFLSRVEKINQNTMKLCKYLRELKASDPHQLIIDINYPRFTTPENYEACRRKPGGGYGGLFSITFASPKAAHTFYDSLETYKGPSLGTNFTLASPYVILAHFKRLEWAAKYGVDANLIRVSVGLEDEETLLQTFKLALDQAMLASKM
ncbi:hypothetical protein O181_004500 [Austropuccinia psidii MF-1]|uniref:Cystathionine gamma-synthase n=1 Tax=Austropuccinia psidii MF-1 TaxID=1389203 RepID=A0A9Q3GEX0_9BASI|nr:hypothetical protein [Austropuccinia psidii MF-1]